MIRDYKTEELFNFFNLHPLRQKHHSEYLSYLNRQAWIFLRPFALVGIVVWLWYGFYFDRVLHPHFPELLYFRLGLSTVCFLIFFISFIERMKGHALVLFLVMTSYLILSCSFFTGILADDPNYVSGLQLIVLLIVLGPFTYRTILVLYFFSGILFLAGWNSYSVVLNSYTLRYSLSNLLISYLVGLLAAFIVERLRFLYFSERLKLQEANKKIWSEVKVAEKIQSVLLPQNPQIKDFQVAVYMKPAEEVGGDYYDIISASGRYWIVIGDVSGHGITAGLIMMMVQTAIKTVLEGDSSLKPSELLNRVNNALLSSIKLIGVGKFMTITVIAYHGDGEFHFSGFHQEILIYRNERKKVDRIETDGSWLGIENNILDNLTDRNFILAKDDIMLVYTDGLTEAWMNNSSEVCQTTDSYIYGNDRLVDAFDAVCKKENSPENIIRGILCTLETYTIIDDITLMALKRL